MSFKEYLKEAAPSNKWDAYYKNCIKNVMSLNWDEKPQKVVQSAENSIFGTIKKDTYSFSWHQPGKYSRTWTFLGLLINKDGKYKDMFDVSGKEMMNDPSEKNQKDNLKDFEDAIKFVKSIR